MATRDSAEGDTRKFRVDLTVAVEVWAEDEQEARDLVKSRANWHAWDLIDYGEIGVE